ncbi:hypothetical protein OAG24_00565 [bacterium]|nr:hypothetical protein [bacterium]
MSLTRSEVIGYLSHACNASALGGCEKKREYIKYLQRSDNLTLGGMINCEFKTSLDRWVKVENDEGCQCSVEKECCKPREECDQNEPEKKCEKKPEECCKTKEPEKECEKKPEECCKTKEPETQEQEPVEGEKKPEVSPPVEESPKQ